MAGWHISLGDQLIPAGYKELTPAIQRHEQRGPLMEMGMRMHGVHPNHQVDMAPRNNHTHIFASEHKKPTPEIQHSEQRGQTMEMGMRMHGVQPNHQIDMAPRNNRTHIFASEDKRPTPEIQHCGQRGQIMERGIMMYGVQPNHHFDMVSRNNDTHIFASEHKKRTPEIQHSEQRGQTMEMGMRMHGVQPNHQIDMASRNNRQHIPVSEDKKPTSEIQHSEQREQTMGMGIRMHEVQPNHQIDMVSRSRPDVVKSNGKNHLDVLERENNMGASTTIAHQATLNNETCSSIEGNSFETVPDKPTPLQDVEPQELNESNDEQLQSEEDYSTAANYQPLFSKEVMDMIPPVTMEVLQWAKFILQVYEEQQKVKLNTVLCSKLPNSVRIPGADKTELSPGTAIYLPTVLLNQLRNEYKEDGEWKVFTTSLLREIYGGKLTKHSAAAANGSKIIDPFVFDAVFDIVNSHSQFGYVSLNKFTKAVRRACNPHKQPRKLESVIIRKRDVDENKIFIKRYRESNPSMERPSPDRSSYMTRSESCTISSNSGDIKTQPPAETKCTSVSTESPGSRSTEDTKPTPETQHSEQRGQTLEMGIRMHEVQPNHQIEMVSRSRPDVVKSNGKNHLDDLEHENNMGAPTTIAHQATLNNETGSNIKGNSFETVPDDPTSLQEVEPQELNESDHKQLQSEEDSSTAAINQPLFSKEIVNMIPPVTKEVSQKVQPIKGSRTKLSHSIRIPGPGKIELAPGTSVYLPIVVLKPLCDKYKQNGKWKEFTTSLLKEIYGERLTEHSAEADKRTKIIDSFVFDAIFDIVNSYSHLEYVKFSLFYRAVRRACSPDKLPRKRTSIQMEKRDVAKNETPIKRYCKSKPSMEPPTPVRSPSMTRFESCKTSSNSGVIKTQPPAETKSTSIGTESSGSRSTTTPSCSANGNSLPDISPLLTRDNFHQTVFATYPPVNDQFAATANTFMRAFETALNAGRGPTASPANPSQSQPSYSGITLCYPQYAHFPKNPLS